MGNIVFTNGREEICYGETHFPRRIHQMDIIKSDTVCNNQILINHKQLVSKISSVYAELARAFFQANQINRDVRVKNLQTRQFLLLQFTNPSVFTATRL